MSHFAFSMLDLLTFVFYAAWFAFLIWVAVRLVRALKAVEEISRSLRIMAYDLREISDDLKAVRDKIKTEDR